MTSTQSIWTEQERGSINEAIGHRTIERHSTDETVARIIARRNANRTAAMMAGVVEGRERAHREIVRQFAIQAATPSEYQWRLAS